MALSLERRDRRLNAWLTGVLVLAVLVLANALARDHLLLRADFSEDRLFELGAPAERLLGELEDVLSVTAYFTGEPKHGVVQIAKRRLLDQLAELDAAARGRIDLSFADPNTDSEAKLAAARYGLVSVPMASQSGTSQEQQDVFFGLVLRYRGRERSLPFVLPQTIEYRFCFELHQLLREAPAVVGFLQPDAGEGGAPFRRARDLLARQYEVRELVDLADGEPVPDDVAVVVVPRPSELHPREVFALDQLVQRGGRLLLLLDELRVDVRTGEATRRATGLAPLLAAWGVSLTPAHVWDSVCLELSLRPDERVEYPLWPSVRQAGVAGDVPATASVNGADFFWAQALESAPVDGVEATPLLSSSERSWLWDGFVSIGPELEFRDAIAAELAAREEPAPHALALSIAGRLPSPFDDGAPAPRDPVEHSLWQERARAARERGEEPPPHPPVGRTDEPVASAAAQAQVVVFGDSDWASDTGGFFTERNAMLFLNLVDWLSLEDDLLALRSRVPRDRPLADFLEEERERRQLSGFAGQVTWDRAGELSRAETAAADAAATRRWRRMALATGGSLALALLIALARRLVPVRRVAGEGVRA